MVDAARLIAFERLLAQRDDRSLRGVTGQRRGHRVTQTGARDRFMVTWLPATRVWSAYRFAALAGAVVGWTPARTEHAPKLRRMR